jgi:hypothetical protein
MKSTKWNQLRADGGTQPCSPEQLTLIKAGFRAMCTDAGASVNDRRELAERTRKARWEGQSPDGKKHEAILGRKPFPYEGASDSRNRTADNITNEQVMIIMAALMRFNLGFAGLPGANAEANDRTAAKLSSLWEYVERNQLGAEWFVEWTKFTQWRQGDSPAVGIMQVYWHQERALRPEQLDADSFIAKAEAAAATAGFEPTPEDVLDLTDLAVNPARLEELAAFLVTLWPELPAARAAKVAAALQTEGEATFPYPYICENRLRVKARRLFHDVFWPEVTTDPQRSSRIDVREWFDEAELREMDAAGAFRPGALEEILKHGGESAWAHFSHYEASGEYGDTLCERTQDKQRRATQYELITTFYRASNADGIPGTYSVQWNVGVEKAVTDQVLLDYRLPGRRYPFIVSAREILSDSLWESRGNSELSATEQGALKILHDMFMDSAALNTIPPLEVPLNRPKLALLWQPMAQIKTARPGEIKPMPTMPFPQAAGEMIKLVKEGLARYFGQISETNPPDLVRLYQQSLVDFMLIPVGEAMTVGLQLCLQFMDRADLMQILGEDGMELADEGKADTVRFRTELDFEAGMLSIDFIERIGAIISKFVLTWDTEATIPRGVLVKWYLGQLSRRLANRLTRPVETVNQSEIEDEENNFAKIAAGIEPPMMEDGQNYALRRETLLGIGQKNPEAFRALTPVSWGILEARLKHFDGMLEQQKNAVIGRTMAAPALPEMSPGAPAAA